MTGVRDASTASRLPPLRRSFALGLLGALIGTLGSGLRLARGQARNDAGAEGPRSTWPRAFSTLSDLRARAGVLGEVGLVGCHSDPVDEGGGLFCWSADVETADDDGTCVVPHGAPRTGSWRRAASGPMNVRWFGARGDGRTNDDKAFAAACAAARTRGLAVYAPRGRYKIRKLSGLDGGFTFSGDGPTSTILCGDTSLDHVIEVTRRSLNRLTLRDFGISGGVDFKPNPKLPRAQVFHGIYFHHNNFGFEVNLSNITIQSCSGSGICDETGLFSSTLSSITIDGVGGSGIDLKGGPCLTLVNCYVLDIARDQVAYRIALGTPVLIACNGINHNNGIAENTTWAEFGVGAGAQCLPTLLGSNVESFSGVGCSFGGASFGNFIGTNIVPALPRRTVALRYVHVPGDTQLGVWDGTSRIYGPAAGGSWGSKRWGQHGHAIEALGNPFVSLNKNVALEGAYIRNDGRDCLSTIPSITSTTSASRKCSLDLSSAVIRDAHFPSEPPPPRPPPRARARKKG